MPIVNKLLLLSLAFIILACGSGTTDTSENTDTIKVDSVGNQGISMGDLSVQVNDSTTLDTISLSSSLVKKWTFKELMKEDYHLKYFLEIDSLKSAGKYTEYLSSLDIGMTKDSRAWIYDTISVESGTAYVWGIYYTSFEACPYFSGKNIYYTTVSKDGVPKATIKLTEISSGGDPPAFGSDWGSCLIGKDFIACTDTSSYGEYGDDGYDDITIVPNFRRYELTADGSISLKENKKGAEINKKRKQKN